MLMTRTGFTTRMCADRWLNFCNVTWITTSLVLLHDPLLTLWYTFVDI